MKAVQAKVAAPLNSADMKALKAKVAAPVTAVAMKTLKAKVAAPVKTLCLALQVRSHLLMVSKFTKK